MIVVTDHCCVRGDLEYWPNATTEEQIPADWRRRMLWFQISTPETQVGLNEIRNLTGEKESNEELKDVLPALSNSSERLEERSKVLMNSVVRSANCLRSPTVWPLGASSLWILFKMEEANSGRREERRTTWGEGGRVSPMENWARLLFSRTHSKSCPNLDFHLELSCSRDFEKVAWCDVSGNLSCWLRRKDGWVRRFKKRAVLRGD